MALLDHLVLKHNFNTDHLFVVLKKAARDFKLVFTFIVNPRLRDLIKRYFRARVPFWQPSTFRLVSLRTECLLH
jgi:hypothetical protein